MKTAAEVREELAATEKTLENVEEAYRNQKIPEEVWREMQLECQATIGTLHWVLGNHDRYD